MTSLNKEDLLRGAARRLARDDFFLASALVAFQSEHALDDDALAAHLGCDLAALSRLALCRRPDPMSPGFRREVEQIAVYAGVAPLVLGVLLRQVQAADAFRDLGPHSTLLAARDAPTQPSPLLPHGEKGPGDEGQSAASEKRSEDQGKAP